MQQDGGKKRRPNRWIMITLTVITVLYAVGWAAYGVMMLNVRITHTYTHPASSPGMLLSDRGTLRWIFTLFWGLRILFPFSVLALFTWGGVRCCFVIWGIVLLLLSAMSLGALLFLSRDFINCNRAGHPGNFCHDDLLCCLERVYTVAASRCDRANKCPTPIDGRPEITNVFVEESDIRIHPDWWWLYGPQIAFVSVELIVIILLTIVTFREPDYMPDNPYPDPSKAVSFTSRVQRAIVGLANGSPRKGNVQ